MLKYCGHTFAAVVAIVSLGCGNGHSPAAPEAKPEPERATPSPVPASSSSVPAPAADPDAVGENPAKPRGRKPFPIHSSCPDVVTIVFGEDPKAPGAGHRTVASHSSIDGPRDVDGKQTVHLLDDKGEPIARVHINRGMKLLEIGRSCRTLDAR